MCRGYMFETLFPTPSSSSLPMTPSTWAPPSGCPIAQDPDIPPFDWTKFPRGTFHVNGPPDETPEQEEWRLDANNSIYNIIRLAHNQVCRMAQEAREREDKRGKKESQLQIPGRLCPALKNSAHFRYTTQRPRR
jgi:hypothetical protein